VDLVTVWLLFLPAALVVMALAAYTLARDGSRAQSWKELAVVAATGCRLGVLSSLMLAIAGLGCLTGPAWVLGWAMIVLGLSGAIGGYLVFRRYLVETDPPRRMQQPGNPSLP
jgi:uncharacterized membrane protein